MTARTEYVVVGGGAMGSATAWHLARGGHEVLLLERFEPGHQHGASHGATRNFNIAYGEPEYLAMLRESLALWRELESASGVKLLSLHGLVNHGAASPWSQIHEGLLAAGWHSEMLDPADAGQRWPGMRFTGPVHFTRDAGTVRADDAVRILQERIIAEGGRVRHGEQVTAIDEDVDGVTVTSLGADGEIRQVRATAVVVTAGAWTTKLLGGLLPLPTLRVTQEQPAHFRPLDPATPWPSFNHAPARHEVGDYWRANIYGMPTPGEGVKIGWHGAGPEIDPDERDYQPDPRVQADLRAYAEAWFPGVDSSTAVPVSCTYTWSPDDDFILDRRGRIIVGAGFSGHGFKFTPAIGRVLADASLGRALPPEPFRRAAH